MRYIVTAKRQYTVTTTSFTDKAKAEELAEFYRNAGLQYTVTIETVAA